MKRINYETNTKFDKLFNRQCEILPLEAWGRIIGIYFSLEGVKYHVRYFFDGELRTDYFYNYEIRYKLEIDER